MVAMAAALFAASGCSKDPVVGDLPPAPTAKIYLPTYNYKTGETITFASQSKDATSLLWNFGDPKPTTSTLQNPTFKYNTLGFYRVSLKAVNETNVNNTDYVTIIIGKRYVDSIVVENFPLNDSTGAAWDNDGTGPDLSLKIRPATAAGGGISTDFYASNAIFQNASPNGTTYTFKPNSFEFVRGSWIFQFIDDDAGTPVQMKLFNIDPASRAYSTNPLILTDRRGWRVLVYTDLQ